MTESKIERPESGKYMRPSEACAEYRCGRTFLHKATKAGKLHALRPSRRLTLYRRDELERLIEGGDAKEAA